MGKELFSVFTIIPKSLYDMIFSYQRGLYTMYKLLVSSWEIVWIKRLWIKFCIYLNVRIKSRDFYNSN